MGHEAVASAREAVRLAPWDPNAHIGLAQALPLIGDLRQADKADHKTPSGWLPTVPPPGSPASLVALGTKNWNAAITASRKALAIEPDNYAALNNLGVALRAAGKRREGTQASGPSGACRSGRTHRPPEPFAGRAEHGRGWSILILLIPIGFLAHVGFILYVVFAIGSNLLISRNPDLVLRLERWAAPMALLFANRTDDEPPSIQRAQDADPTNLGQSSDEE